MPSLKFNPTTSRLDLVGSSGGGAGTVTSVAGGTGITNSPEPIIGAGTINLDIDSLTAEATLAAGDFFPFVDVSGGGSAIANQRKVTFSNFLAAISTGLSALGFVDGSGAAGRVAFWSDANSLTSDSALTYDSTTDILSVPVVDLTGLTTAEKSALPLPTTGRLLYDTTLAMMQMGEDAVWRTPLVLEGRLGTANNPVISLTAGGRITGGNAGNLELRANSLSVFAGTVDTMNALRVDTDITGQILGGQYNHVSVAPVAHTWGDGVIIRALNHATTVTLEGDITSVQLFRSGITITAADAITHTFLSTYYTLRNNPLFNPVGATTFADLAMVVASQNPTLSNTGTANTALGIYSAEISGSIGATWTATDWALGRMRVPAGGGVATRMGGIEIDDLATFAGTLTNAPYSIWSKGATVSFCHYGPLLVGVNQATLTFPAASAGIELRSTTKAMLDSRMTTAQKNLLTPVNGMHVHDDTLGKMAFYENGAWVTYALAGGGVAAHNFLDSTVHNNTLTGTPVRGDLIVANTTPAWARFARGTANQALVMNAGATDPTWAALVRSNVGSASGTTDTFLFQTAPTIVTSVVVPLVIGGTGATDDLTLRSSSGAGGTSNDIIFQVGNNGATEAMRILGSGIVGIGTAAPAANAFLEIGASATSSFRNRTRTVFTPTTAQAITAASSTILANATFVMISNSTGAGITITANPTIVDGEDGQILIILQTGANNVIVQNGNNLDLGAASRTMTQNDILMLIFSATTGDWMEMGFVQN